MIKKSVEIAFALTAAAFFACDIFEPEEEPYYATRTVQEIWVIDLEKKTDTFLTLGVCPFFTSNSQDILFCRDDFIWRMGIDGAKPSPISPRFDYLWSYDIHTPTDRIVFHGASLANNSTDIFLIQADGQGFINLCNTAFDTEASACFSPDGSQIVFEQNSSICKMDLRSKEISQIMDRSTTASSFSDAQLNFSNDKIICRFHPSLDILIISVSAGTIEKTIELAGQGDFAVCPTRDELLFYQRGLQVMDLNTYETTKIVDNAGMPAYSPDGSKEVFLDSKRQMVMIDADGGNYKVCKEPLSGDVYKHIKSYAVSPDNQKIVYSIYYEVEIR